MMNINSYYPSSGAAFGHQPLSLHDTAGHQLSNGFHHSVSAAGFMSPAHYSSRPICPGYDLPGSQTKSRFVADGDDALMRSGASDVNATPARDHPSAGYASLGDPAAHHAHAHHHLHHHHQQQQVSRWGMTVPGDGSSQTSTPPPPQLMQTSAFNHAVQPGAGHHVHRPATTDTSPPAVSCHSPHSAATGFNSAGHVPFYPWMGVVGKQQSCLIPRLFLFFFTVLIIIIETVKLQCHSRLASRHV